MHHHHCHHDLQGQASRIASAANCKVQVKALLVVLQIAQHNLAALPLG